jgi:hypothetical protein
MPLVPLTPDGSRPRKRREDLRPEERARLKKEREKADWKRRNR